MAKANAKTKAKTKAATKRAKPKLPDTMSGLIRVALADLQAVEKLKSKYRIDMDDWHVPNGKCAVCFAGSVMAMTLGVSPETRVQSLSWEDVENNKTIEDLFDEKTSKKLRALDELRTGNVYQASERLDIYPKSNGILKINFQNVDVTSYHESPARFKKDMAKLANDLEAAGF